MAEVEDLASLSNPSPESVELIRESSVAKAPRTKEKSSSFKRPVNPFILWSRAERKSIMKEGKIQGAEVSKELGKRWKSLAEDARQLYIDEALRLRSEFLEQYPEGSRQRAMASKTPKSPAKSLVKKRKLAKSSNDFDPRAIASPVSKPAINAPNWRQAVKKTLSSFGRCSPSGASECQLQFKIDENFTSNSDSVLDKTEGSAVLSKLLKRKCDKRDKLSKESVELKGLPTSGDICRAAIKSGDCIHTFDFLSNFVIKNAGNLTEKVCDIVTEYNELIFATRELIFSSFDDPSCKDPVQSLPLMSDLIGDEWMLPNMGFELLP